MDQVSVGVDTHKSNHIAVAINSHGALLGSMPIAATQDGYRRLEAWATGLGQVTALCVEGTGSFGAGLSRDLQAKEHTVLAEGMGLGANSLGGGLSSPALTCGKHQF
jgi:transposase